MTSPIQFPGEDRSNEIRALVASDEPVAQRTFTPSQAVLAKSAGTFHFTPEGRRLYDYSSGVLVSNLGHNPRRWMQRFSGYLGWKPEHLTGEGEGDYFEAVTLTSYNAITEIEATAADRLLKSMRTTAFGKRLGSVLWAASGSEAVQKALWCCLHRDEKRDLIIATRYGFHGKKGLSGAVTGSEKDADRDPRVKFISFPMEEIDDVSKYDDELDLTPYRKELDALWEEYGSRLNCLITEPYLGGGGSYHPPLSYHKMLREWCDEHDVLFIMDEVQANFGRTGKMYAFEKYEIEPDLVCLGKGMGNGVPVNATVGRKDVLASLTYGEGSDTWSAAPLGCAALLATLDEFEQTDVMENTARLSEKFFAGLEKLKETGIIARVRGEGMVFGIECAGVGSLSPQEVATEVVRACYLGEEGGDGIHLLGALAGKVLRVSPPMTMTAEEADASLELLYRLLSDLAGKLQSAETAGAGAAG
ncbi:aspartate aminotransferase family protein [Maioricimonas sp. JC845]|uniref:aspartate aminotransferase family protein n=1 Tax=Maioricimonas sp. JC845 TaxID=3232138 RepID=UPI003459BBAB